MITVEVKKEIVEKYERGMRVAEIARFYKKSTSTICTILKKKEEIRGLDAAKGVTRISKQRPRVLEDVEKLLLVWINEKRLAEGLAHEQQPPVVGETVSLGKTRGLEVSEDDSQELVEEHGQEPTTDELMGLHRKQQQEVMGEISSAGEKKAEESLTSSEIREMCEMWETVQKFVEKHHPNKAVAVRAMNLFNDSAMSHFREILKRRQKQVSLDRFPVKVARKERESTEPIDSSDSVSDGESRPTQ
ncbi:Hypothetical predicted protein [Lynx pardinus]|uniref:HTH psq-type domain-containing protein n=1 Tax=Lynx pardinus TaxID=191816 RepID=A0A485NWX5_LYNPA|nr:Hypothetical predicted protein [Lynx pardinus]